MDLLKPLPTAWRVLSLGTAGQDVIAWQSVLRLEPKPTGWQGYWPIAVDGQYGPISERATKAYQAVHGLPVTGVVDQTTAATVPLSLFAPPNPAVTPGPLALPPIAFFPARDFGWANRTRVDTIVLHSAEAGEGHSTAEALGAYFKHPIKPSSSHYGVDDDSICQYVPDQHIAFHAPGANTYGLGIEQAGYAKQTRAEWLDPYGERMLRLVARLIAVKATQWHVPLVWLTPADLVAGKRGLCTHVDVSQAFHKSDHVDPGRNYPKDAVLDWATAALRA